MGYPTLQKGYYVLDPSAGEFFVSRDIIFHETIFPFRASPEDLDISNSPHLSSIEENISPEYFLAASPRQVIQPSSVDQSTQQAILERDSALPINNEYDSGEQITNNAAEVSSPPPPTDHPRRSGRATKPPAWTKDYVCASLNGPGIHYPISSYVSFDKLSSEHRCCISHISDEKEPSSYHEASKDPWWQKAMEAELQALSDNHTWEIVLLPSNRKSIGCK